MHILRNRKLTMLIAGVMAVVLICLGVFIHTEQVEAKDTLEGIRTIAAAATESNPYTILEIVPDVATTTGFPDGELVSGNSITQSMGMIGYYIGGQEPVQLSRDLLQFQTAENRKEYVDRLYKKDGGTVTGALKEITDHATDAAATKPLTFKEYVEVYAFERSTAELQAGLADESLKLLDYNPLPKDGTVGMTTEHIETTVGYRRDAKTGDDALTGNLIKKYVRTETETDDPALKFFSGNTNTGFGDSAAHDGDFDPGFQAGSDYYVRFSAVNGRIGYVPVSTAEIPLGQTWEDHDGDVWEGRPVYKSNNGVFEYVGNVAKDTASEVGKTLIGVKDDNDVLLDYHGAGLNVAVLSLEATGAETGTTETTDETMGEPATDGTTGGTTGEPTGGTTETISGETGGVTETTIEAVNGTVSQNMLRGNASTAGSYMTVQFEYQEPAESGVQVYRVDYYEKGDTVKGKQYALDIARPLVPNATLTGLVKTESGAGNLEDTTPERFLYTLARGTNEGSTEDVHYGSYTLTSDESAAGQYRLATDISLYYTGGFSNNEWFKKNVFDRDDSECANLYINVVTKTINEVTDTDIEHASFIYLSDSTDQFLAYPLSVTSPLETTYSPYGHTDVEGKEHDITALRAFYILRQALTLKVPLVSDYSIMTSADNIVKGSNMYSLVRALHMDGDKLQTLYNARKDAMETVTSESEQTLKDALSGIVDADLTSFKHYVKSNIYSYYLTNTDLAGQTGMTAYSVINGEFRTAFSNDVITERFEEVLKDIENENLYRETDGGKPALDKTISEATTLRYIINFNYKRAQVQKATLHILELEPCASWDLSCTNTKMGTKTNGILYYKADVPAQKKELVNQEDTEIILTQMTTSEFIGKNEDINAVYDMVYIGLNTGLMNMKNGKTDYNDNAMDGMVYTNVGDFVHVQPALGGMLNIDYINNNRANYLKGRTYYPDNNVLGRYRYSGNDITEEKRKALEDFIAAGYPIIVENDIISVNQTTDVKTANDSVLDNSSYMYELIQNMKDKKNMIRLDQATSSLFNWYLNLSKPVITMTAGTKAANSMTQTQPLLQATDGYYYLQYQFTLTNVGAADTNTACDCKLYVDINADGKFSKTKERIKDIVITDGWGNQQSPDHEGNFSLSPGKEYHVKRAISNEYTGVVPWKLEVTQQGNTARRAGAMGFFEIKRDEKETINILQIKTAGNNNNVDLAAAMKNEKSMFYHYISILDNFDLTITSMTSTEYKAKHDEHYQASGGYSGGNEFLNQYDMLIIGFSDVYKEASNDTGAMTAIRDYIEAGHSILFTHDTTSLSNVPEGQFYAREKNGQTTHMTDDANNYTGVDHFGYSFNTLIRGLVGMDRYGILGPNQDILRRGVDINNSSGDWNKLTNKSENGKKDITYVPGSKRTKITPEVQGFTYLWLNWLRENKDSTYANYKNIKDNMGQYNGQTIHCVNSGQITTYPYKLDKDFYVAQTHSQYYQLDFESDDDGDGESDIVVWYTIDDRNTSISDDIYKFSPGDVRNNYYIYNKGNITYSGVGHSNQEKQHFEDDYSASKNANEVQLFINTMIAAYRAGLRAPKVSVLDNKEYTSRKINNIYLAYDEQLEVFRKETNPLDDGLLDATEDVFFTADQVSFVEGEQLLVARYFYESDDADAVSLIVDKNEEPVKVKELTGICTLHRASDETIPAQLTVDGHQTYALEPSKVYRFAVPAALLKSGKNSTKIYIEVTTVHENTKTGKDEMMSGYGQVSLVRTQMFDLD